MGRGLVGWQVRVVLLGLWLCSLVSLARAVPLKQGSGPKDSVWHGPIRLSEPGLNGIRYFLDSSGRQLYFRGVNAVVKGPPWHPAVDAFDYRTSLVDKDFEILQAAGFTIMRLGIMWPGVEPVRGQYNMTYLAITKSIVDKAAAYGIYTLLDMHQDAMSAKFCGEGIPDWAVQPSGSFAFPEPVDFAYKIDPKTGEPSKHDCSKRAWSSYYFSEAASTAFQALYDNKDGLLDAWADMWATVAKYFKDDGDVIGLELINEPWAGDVVHDPSLLVPKKADTKNFQRVYDRLAEAIWKIDPARLVFFSGITWDDFGTGFAHPPGGPSNAYRSVLSYHHYEWPYGPQLKNTSLSSIRIYVRDAARLGVAAMLTEFSEANGPYSTYPETTEGCDVMLQSWIQWEYKIFCIDSEDEKQEGKFGACKTGWGGYAWDEKTKAVMPGIMQQWSRTYAQAVAGNLTLMHLDPLSQIFRMEFLTSGDPALATVIYASKSVYKTGYKITISPEKSANYANPTPNMILITVAAGTQAGAAIRVTVEPK